MIHKQLFLLKQNLFPILFFEFWHKLFALLILFPLLKSYVNFTFYPLLFEYIDFTLFFEEFHFLSFLIGVKFILIWIYVEYIFLRYYYRSPSIYLKDFMKQPAKEIIHEFFNLHQFIPFSFYASFYLFTYWLMILLKPSISILMNFNLSFYSLRIGLFMGYILVIFLFLFICPPNHSSSKKTFIYSLLGFMLIYNLSFYLIEFILTMIIYPQLDTFSYGRLLSLRLSLNTINALCLLILIPLFISSLMNVNYTFKPMFKFDRYHRHDFSRAVLSISFFILFVATYVSFSTRIYRQPLFDVPLIPSTRIISINDSTYINATTMTPSQINHLNSSSVFYVFIDDNLDSLNQWKQNHPNNLVLSSNLNLPLNTYIDGYFVDIDQLAITNDNVYTLSTNQSYPIQKALAFNVTGLLTKNPLLVQAQIYDGKNGFMHLFNFLNS